MEEAIPSQLFQLQTKTEAYQYEACLWLRQQTKAHEETGSKNKTKNRRKKITRTTDAQKIKKCFSNQKPNTQQKHWSSREAWKTEGYLSRATEGQAVLGRCTRWFRRMTGLPCVVGFELYSVRAASRAAGKNRARHVRTMTNTGDILQKLRLCCSLYYE